jgi:hypothetical protein
MLLLTINRNPSKGGQQKGSCTFSQRATEEVAENLASAPRRQQLFLIETDRQRFDTRTVRHVIADGGWKCTGGGRPTIRTLFTDETMLGHFQSQWWEIKDLTANRLFSAPDLIERCTTACAGCR